MFGFGGLGGCGPPPLSLSLMKSHGRTAARTHAHTHRTHRTPTKETQTHRDPTDKIRTGGPVRRAWRPWCRSSRPGRGGRSRGSCWPARGGGAPCCCCGGGGDVSVVVMILGGGGGCVFLGGGGEWVLLLLLRWWWWCFGRGEGMVTHTHTLLHALTHNIISRLTRPRRPGAGRRRRGFCGGCGR